jgi:membrane protease YdiL (CAAX protease family)
MQNKMPPIAEQPPKTPWGALTALLVVVVTYIVTLVIGQLVLSIYPSLHHWTPSHANSWLQNSVIAQFGYVLLVETLTLAAIYLFIRHRKGTLAQIGLGKWRWSNIGKAVLGFVAYFAIYLAVYSFIAAFVHQINLQQQQDVGFHGVSGNGALLLTFLSLVVLPPIAEEIVFRGFLYSGLRRSLSMLQAGIITSLIFASAHLLEGTGCGPLWVAGIDTFILSMVLVYLREKTGNVYAGMLVHALKNSVAFFVLYHVALGL